MRVCILGAGGLGSVFGGYLAETGVDVTLVARPAHADAVRRNGLRIEGRRGSRVIRDHLAAVTHPSEAVGEFDYLILAVKSKDTKVALSDADELKSRVKTVCSIQNNVVKEGILSRWAGAGKVLGASTIEAGTLDAPGLVTNQLTTDPTFYCGEMDGTISERAEILAEALTRAGLSSKAVDCIQQVLWEKLVQIGIAAAWSVSTLMGNRELTLPDGLCLREGAEHYAAVAREALAVYAAMGYQPQDFYAPMSRLRDLHNAVTFEAAVEFMLTYGQMMKSKGITLRASMHLDALRGKKTEVDYTIKPIVDKAAELGVPVPSLLASYRIIKVLDHYLA